MNITLCDISKHYTLKKALNKVSVSFAEGKIHALLGENGAGKSTLANIITGSVIPTAGSISIDDTQISFRSTKDALAAGISCVQQRPLLATSITARENILLGLKSSLFSLFTPPKELMELKQIWCPTLDLNSKVKDLGGNYRFYIALLKALLHHPKCLILDEPSAFLDMDERQKLYTSLKELASKGTNIIVITHSTAEAVTYTDDVVILKEGSVHKIYATSKLYEQEIDTTDCNDYPKTNITSDKNLFSANKKKCFELINAQSRPKNRPILMDACLTVNYGEITAVSGLKEAALDTLEDLVTGMVSSYSKGFAIHNSSNQTYKLNLSKGELTSRYLRKHKVSIIPSDRTFRASNPELTVQQLLTPYYRGSKPYDYSINLINKANINITPEQKAFNLSGGMLQRLILQRELSQDPTFIILCNPMQGLDIASQSTLAYTIQNLAQAGKAILIVGTQDFPLTLCSRVYTLQSGILNKVFELSDNKSTPTGDFS